MLIVCEKKNLCRYIMIMVKYIVADCEASLFYTIHAFYIVEGTGRSL